MLNATVTLLSAPDQVTVGVPFSASFRIQNTGTEYWVPDMDFLGAWNPQDATYWGNTRAICPVWINPGASADFTVSTFIPGTPGAWPFQWRPVRERVAWYGAASTAKAITVVAAPVGPGGPSIPIPIPIPNPGGVILGKWPKKRADAADVLGCMVLNTDAFAANGARQTARWKNDTGEVLRITAARLWLGVSLGGHCDAHGQLEREDGSLMAVLQADHYVDGPAGAAVEHQYYGGASVYLLPNEAIVLTYFANGFTPGCQAHFTVSIWGQYAGGGAT